MLREHMGESVPRGRGWDGPGLGNSPLPSFGSFPSGSNYGDRGYRTPVPTGICKPCKSSPHGGPIAAALAFRAAAGRLASTKCGRLWAGVMAFAVSLARLRSVGSAEATGVETEVLDTGFLFTDLPPSGEG